MSKPLTLRVMGFVTGEETFEAYRDVAVQVFGVKPEEVRSAYCPDRMTLAFDVVRQLSIDVIEIGVRCIGT